MTSLIWDRSTAYDLFISLYVLFHPEEHGLRRAWAAGVRSRLPAGERELLGAALDLALAPLPWITGLPSPRDGATFIAQLAQLPPASRWKKLALSPSLPGSLPPLLHSVAARGSWTRADWQTARASYAERKEPPPNKNRLTRLLDLWANADAVGEQLLAAFRYYYTEFFAEEEKRILPHLSSAAERAAELAESVPLPALLDQLAQGVRFTSVPSANELVMVPSFWITPLVLLSDLGHGRRLLVFGARPADLSLIPGELVPGSLTNALKALADPTRLRILHYVSQSPRTPAELSRHLRLRPPTVTHHLQTLRVAGLLRVSIEPNGRRQYAARLEAIAAQFSTLQAFLSSASDNEVAPPEQHS